MFHLNDNICQKGMSSDRNSIDFPAHKHKIKLALNEFRAIVVDKVFWQWTM